MSDDANKAELVRKVSQLVRERFGNNYESAFAHYASKRGGNGTVDEEELGDLLKDAGIGSWATRGIWVDGVMKELDRDRDKKIGWSEFESSMRR
jgi:hypothetical protein